MDGLDIVRFLAALWVAFYHLGYHAFATPDHWLRVLTGRPPEFPIWGAVSWFGWIGVQIFFVLSGVVIAYSADNATPAEFFRGRIFRLFPAMLISATVLGAISILWLEYPLGTMAVLWLKSILFFPVGPWLSGQFWTLPIEIVFYGAIGLMIAAKIVKDLERLAWVLAAVSGFYWLAMSWGFHDMLGLASRLFLIQHGCYFALGIVQSRLARGGLDWKQGILAAVCIATAWPQIHATTIAEEPGYGLEAWAGVPYLVWLAAVGAIAASILYKDAVRQLLGFLQGHTRQIGVMTYPLYLVHIQCGGLVLVAMLTRGFSPSLALLSALAVSIASAALVTFVLEPPVRQAMRAIWKPARPAPVSGKLPT